MAEPIVVVPELKRSTKRQPPYNVVLLNDDFHTAYYVVAMMKKLFAMTDEDGIQIAQKVHNVGEAICLTTTMEHAELKRDQIHAFGADPLAKDCVGAMSAAIEPVS